MGMSRTHALPSTFLVPEAMTKLDKETGAAVQEMTKKLAEAKAAQKKLEAELEELKQQKSTAPAEIYRLEGDVLVRMEQEPLTPPPRPDDKTSLAARTKPMLNQMEAMDDEDVESAKSAMGVINGLMGNGFLPTDAAELHDWKAHNHGIMFGYVNALYECITSHGGVESATAHSACAPQMEEAKDWLDTTARVSLSATVPEVAETFGFRGDDVDRYLIRLADAVKESPTDLAHLASDYENAKDNATALHDFKARSHDTWMHLLVEMLGEAEFSNKLPLEENDEENDEVLALDDNEALDDDALDDDLLADSNVTQTLLIRAIARGVSRVYRSASRGISRAYNSVKNAYNNFKNKIKNGFNSFTSYIRNFGNAVANLAKTIFDGVKKALSSVFNGLFSACGSSSMLGIVERQLNSHVLPLAKVKVAPSLHCGAGNEGKIKINTGYPEVLQAGTTMKLLHKTTLAVVLQLSSLKFHCGTMGDFLKRMWKGPAALFKLLGDALAKIPGIKHLKDLWNSLKSKFNWLKGIGLGQMQLLAIDTTEFTTLRAQHAKLANYSNTELAEWQHFGRRLADFHTTELVDIGHPEAPVVVPRTSVDVQALSNAVVQHVHRRFREHMHEFMQQDVQQQMLAAGARMLISELWVTLTPIIETTLSVRGTGLPSAVSMDLLADMADVLNKKREYQIQIVPGIVSLNFAIQPEFKMPLDFAVFVKGRSNVHLKLTLGTFGVNVMSPTQTSRTTPSDVLEGSYVESVGGSSISAHAGLALKSSLKAHIGLCFVSSFCGGLTAWVRHHMMVGADVGFGTATQRGLIPAGDQVALKNACNEFVLHTFFTNYCEYPKKKLAAYEKVTQAAAQGGATSRYIFGAGLWYFATLPDVKIYIDTYTQGPASTVMCKTPTAYLFDSYESGSFNSLKGRDGVYLAQSDAERLEDQTNGHPLTGGKAKVPFLLRDAVTYGVGIGPKCVTQPLNRLHFNTKGFKTACAKSEAEMKARDAQAKAAAAAKARAAAAAAAAKLAAAKAKAAAAAASRLRRMRIFSSRRRSSRRRSRRGFFGQVQMLAQDGSVPPSSTATLESAVLTKSEGDEDGGDDDDAMALGEEEEPEDEEDVAGEDDTMALDEMDAEEDNEVAEEDAEEDGVEPGHEVTNALAGENAEEQKEHDEAEM